jgi:hypothetical protein
MMRLRSLLLTGAFAVASVGAGIAMTAQPAHAFVVNGDYCNSYTAGWIYWANEASVELSRNDFEETPYFQYAWGKVNYYSSLMWQYNCP